MDIDISVEPDDVHWPWDEYAAHHTSRKHSTGQ